MKVLVSTAQGQGEDPDDHCWTEEGELVRLVECPDPLCTYVAFAGTESQQATSTALVEERRDLDPALLEFVFRRDSENQGLCTGRPVDEVREEIEAEVAEMVELLRDLEPGTVVERAGARLRIRQVMA